MMAAQEIKQKSGVDTLLVTREVECDTYFGVEYVPAMNDWVGVGFLEQWLEMISFWNPTRDRKDTNMQMLLNYTCKLRFHFLWLI